MNKLVSIIGLTSSGKSDLAIELAKRFNGEIVSADSRQVYKGLDWCSGKVSNEEQTAVKHHLLDVAEIGGQFTLFDFQKMAYSSIDDIISRHKTPFMVGGTGMYSRSVVEGYNLVENQFDKDKRAKLEQMSKDDLILLCKSKGIDVPAETTARRLIRMLETSDVKKTDNSPRYNVLQIGIFWDRETIYNRIEKRLKMRMPNMIQEIKNLLECGKDKEFLLSLGLEAKYVIKFLDGEFSSYDDFFAELFKEERHFAKRQQTWYNKEKNTIWLNADENLLENASALVEKFLSEK